MNRNESWNIKLKHLEAFRKSGMTAESWCKENNIKLSTLRYWITKFNKESKLQNIPDDFILFPPKASKEIPIIINSAPFTIELHTGFKAETLLEVLAVLKRL